MVFRMRFFSQMYFFVSHAVCCLLAGLIVGIIIRYGLDAEKHLFILECSHNMSNSPESDPPTSVVVWYNNTEYFEYTNGKKVDHDYVAQPQFEDKVIVCHFCSPVRSTVTNM